MDLITEAHTIPIKQTKQSFLFFNRFANLGDTPQNIQHSLVFHTYDFRFSYPGMNQLSTIALVHRPNLKAQHVIQFYTETKDDSCYWF